MSVQVNEEKMEKIEGGALPAETSNVIDAGFVCENPDCDAFGDAVES